METTNKKAVNNSQGTIILPTQKEEKITTPSQSLQPPTKPNPTISQIFDKLKNYLAYKGQYEHFSEKLQELITYQETVDNSGLSMILKNTEGMEIEITSQGLIKEFVNLAVSRGQEHKTKMESNILAFQL